MDRFRPFLFSLHADAFLVTHFANIAYLCGFTGSNGILLVETSRATLFTDSRYTLQAAEQVHDAKVSIVSGNLLLAVADHLNRRRSLRLAYSPSQLTVAQKHVLDAKLAKLCKWIDGGNAIERLRAIKDPAELAAMREAAKIIDASWKAGTRCIRPGVSELEVVAEIEYAIKMAGASGPSFETIVASGPRSAWAHARPTSKLLRKNELVVMDQGAILRGYCSDMTRTVFLGRASSRIRRMYRAVLQSQEAAKSVIRPGVKAGDVDAAARSTLKKSGFAHYFTHSTGHGLGAEVHEMPRLGRGEEILLEQGMVVTVEPGVYIEGLGGIRIEDDMLVTSNGAESLTGATREFLEL